MTFSTLPEQLATLRTRPVRDLADMQQLIVDLATTIQSALNEIVTVVNDNSNGASTYTVTNPSTSRTIDVSAATLAEVRAVLGTLLTDLGAS